jgi:NADPH2:quinone reductase
VQAIEVRQFGGPEVLELVELPDPVPGPGQVLVATAASDVLFVDTMIRSGRAANYFPIQPPYIPGNGVGGIVTALGDGVERGWMGEAVVAHTGGPGGQGGYSALAVADVGACAAIPESVELLDATAVLHDGTTALRVLEVTGPEAGEWVLVLGAAGGMGILLVQLLTSRGAHVVGAARGRTKQEVVAAAGAEVSVDYARPDWAERVLEATGGHRPTVVLDGVGGTLGSEAFGLMSDGGRFSAHGSPSGSFARIDGHEARLRGISVTTIADLQYQEGERSKLLLTILQELRRGHAAPLVGQILPLAQAEKAHLAIEARETIAKSLLIPG